MSDYAPKPRKHPDVPKNAPGRWVGMATNGFVWLFCSHRHVHQDTARACSVKLARKANDEYRTA